jgi:hypothetical protein
MRYFRKILVISSSFLILVLFLLFVVVPYVLAGPPTPLFISRNYDTGEHELRVEVFDSKNNSVLEDVYRLSVGEEISQVKPVKFLVPGFEVWDCTLTFTLDDTFVETYHTNIQPWNTVEVEIYSEGQPLSVGESTV